MITLERLSEIIKRAHPGDDRNDLFEIAVEYLGLHTEQQLSMFAVMCGYEIAQRSEIP